MLRGNAGSSSDCERAAEVLTTAGYVGLPAGHSGGRDRVEAGKGDDYVDGGSSADFIRGGPGRDWLIGGGGPDVILAGDGERDTIACGWGNDVVVADAIDKVGRDCDLVARPVKQAVRR